MTIPRVAAMVLIAVLAIIAVFSGIDGIVRGSKAQRPEAVVESNFRFLSAFLLTAGAVLAWCLFYFDDAAVPLRIVCATIFIGALARLLAIPAAGKPDRTYLIYIVVEIVGSVAIVALHAVATVPTVQGAVGLPDSW